jgi:hypothetical protein
MRSGTLAADEAVDAGGAGRTGAADADGVGRTGQRTRTREIISRDTKHKESCSNTQPVHD